MIFAAVKLSNYRLAKVCVVGVQVPRTFQVSVYLLRPHYMWFTVYNKYTFEYKKQVKLKNSYLPPYLGLKHKIYMQISFNQFKIQFDLSVKVSNNGGHIQVVMLTYQKIGVDLSIQLQLYL